MATKHFHVFVETMCSLPCGHSCSLMSQCAVIGACVGLCPTHSHSHLGMSSQWFPSSTWTLTGSSSFPRQLWCKPAAWHFWHGSARLGGVTAALAGLALCPPVLCCCQCVFGWLLEVRFCVCCGVLWLPGGVVGLGGGFCWWHCCIMTALMFGVTDEGCSQGQEITPVNCLWSRPTFLDFLRAWKKTSLHQYTCSGKGILLGGNILAYNILDHFKSTRIWISGSICSTCKIVSKIFKHCCLEKTT